MFTFVAVVSFPHVRGFIVTCLVLSVNIFTDKPNLNFYCLVLSYIIAMDKEGRVSIKFLLYRIKTPRRSGRIS